MGVMQLKFSECGRLERTDVIDVPETNSNGNDAIATNRRVLVRTGDTLEFPSEYQRVLLPFLESIGAAVGDGAARFSQSMLQSTFKLFTNAIGHIDIRGHAVGNLLLT